MFAILNYTLLHNQNDGWNDALSAPEVASQPHASEH
jgi:hypothetical protein